MEISTISADDRKIVAAALELSATAMEQRARSRKSAGPDNRDYRAMLREQAGRVRQLGHRFTFWQESKKALPGNKDTAPSAAICLNCGQSRAHACGKSDPERKIAELQEVIDRQDRVLRSQNRRINNATQVIREFGWIDGGHHKAWVIDQAIRHLSDGVERMPDWGIAP